MLHKFLIEIDTDEATTEELHKAIYQAIKWGLRFDNGDSFYADFPKVEPVTDAVPNERNSGAAEGGPAEMEG